jgi:drug/metabolite transporter (DMT)-like permease
MINFEILAICYGLFAAASWGTGDFCGGIAAKQTNVFSVVMIANVVGLFFIITLAYFFSVRIPSFNIIFHGGMAGIFGGLGFVALYSGLAQGRMGIVAPIAGVVSAVIPVIAGLFIEGLPSKPQLTGFGIAILGVWLLSNPEGNKKYYIREFTLAVSAGLGFGLFFIFIDRVSDHAIIWPLAFARITSTVMLFILALVFRQWKITPLYRVHIIILNGLFEVGGSLFFALATHIGRLDVSAVLSSFYPGATVLLSWFILKEKLFIQQWIGVLAALVAVVLFSY